MVAGHSKIVWRCCWSILVAIGDGLTGFCVFSKENELRVDFEEAIWASKTRFWAVFSKNGRWCGGGVECVLGCICGIRTELVWF